MTQRQVLGVRMMAVGLFVSPLAAQWVTYPTAGVPRTPDGKPNLNAACPRTADGKPDLSGLWVMQPSHEPNPNFPGCEAIADEFANIGVSLKGGLPYQPWAADLVKARRSEQRLHDPMSHCLPIGPVRLNTFTTPSKMIQTPGLLLILNEWNASYRQIFTDGRPLPVDPNPSWNGYSSGKWDGDTLVIETNGFRDGLWLDAAGNPMTDAARLTERFRRPNFGHMEIEITVSDPKAYTRPFTVTLHHTIKLDTELLDFVCNENEQDASHLSSK
ncbi:MAG: hypothetical protein LAP40_00780 [Acidobacteriia bacterium]|nr:hypothetical protein [Terriglobia bacterium]